MLASVKKVKFIFFWTKLTRAITVAHKAFLSMSPQERYMIYQITDIDDQQLLRNSALELVLLSDKMLEREMYMSIRYKPTLAQK